MTLRTYKKKRTFEETPEPKPKVKPSPKKKMPVFCVQKHDASHLHYDFRIECKGVMISWAIPKGPSLDPSQKHLAIHVEDHPLDYRNFEGVIPEGNYGAGAVMIWDEGIFAVPGGTTKKEIEDLVEEGFEKGHIELVIMGTKLRGGFVLQRLKKDEDKSWIFFKMKDEEANSKKDILKEDRSVRSNKTIDEIFGKKKIKKNADG